MAKPDISIYIKARYPLLYVVSHEEGRVLNHLEEVATALRLQMHVWSYTEGLYNVALPAERNTDLREPQVVLEHIIERATQGSNHGERSLYVLRDYHPFITNAPDIIRRLRELADYLRRSKMPMTVVILSPVLQIPTEIEKKITVIDFPLPTESDLAARIDTIGQKLTEKGAVADLDHRARERLIKATMGLTMDEAELAIAKALMTQGRLNDRAVDVVNEEKRQIIRKSGLLEYYEPRLDLTAVGGLENLKDWLGERQDAMTSDAREFGLPMPKGLLLVGVPGCGKSLTAKAIGATWKLPVLRLDVGRLFAGVVGSSESNTRQVQKLAEAMAPCILWCDEIEKGMSGAASSNFSDAGTASRVFGSLLTWMQDKEAPVFLVATANEIDQLPAALVRKGRFDEIFFVDLPNQAEREAILKIHLLRVKRDPATLDLSAIAAAAEDFTGSEIEELVVTGLYAAFRDGKRALTTADLLGAARNTVPLAKTMSEQIKALRKWSKTHARSASRELTFADPTLPDGDDDPTAAVAVDLFSNDGHA